MPIVGKPVRNSHSNCKLTVGNSYQDYYSTLVRAQHPEVSKRELIARLTPLIATLTPQREA